MEVEFQGGLLILETYPGFWDPRYSQPTMRLSTPSPTSQQYLLSDRTVPLSNWSPVLQQVTVHRAWPKGSHSLRTDTHG